MQIICIFCIISSYSAAILHYDFDVEKSYKIIYEELKRQHLNENYELDCIISELKKNLFAQTFHYYSTKGNESNEIEEDDVFSGQIFKIAVKNEYNKIIAAKRCQIKVNETPTRTFYKPDESDTFVFRDD